MLMPKRTKFRRPHRVSYEGKAKNSSIINGDYALLAMEGAWITNRQIEAARVAMTRHMKRLGKVWINIFPHLAKTKKPLEVRQGKGKGNVEYWVCQIQPGKMLYEMEGVSEEVARQAFKLASAKLPFSTTFVSRQAM